MNLPHERSAGIIIFQDEPRKYLILQKPRGTEFPKGHVEKGETDREAALREVFEETGLKDIEILPGFRHRIRFTFRKSTGMVSKSVSYFLGRTRQEAVTLSKEHKAYEWLPPEQAIARLRYKNQKTLVKKAEEFLNRQ